MRIAKLIKVFGLAAALTAPLALVGCDDDEGTVTPDGGGNVVKNDASTDVAQSPADTGAKLDTAANTDSSPSGDASPGN